VSVRSLTRLLAVSLILSWMTGCVALQTISAVSSLGSAYYANSAANRTTYSAECAFGKPIYLENQSISGMVRADKEQIVAHNAAMDKFCNKYQQVD
jgi:hypothetical protein